MLPAKIPFSFLFWKIIMIMSTTDDSSTRSEIIKVMNAQMKNFEAIDQKLWYRQMWNEWHKNIS